MDPACSPFSTLAYTTPVLLSPCSGAHCSGALGAPPPTPPSGLGLRTVPGRQIRLFPSQTHPPRSLPPSCSHQVQCLCVSKLLGQIEFKSFSQKYYNSHGKVGHSCIPGYGGWAVIHRPRDILPQLPPGQDILLSLALKTLSELTLSTFLSLPSER